MTNDLNNDQPPPKCPSKWLLLVIAAMLVIGPFTTPNLLWFCWSCAGSLIYIYINMSLRYKRWEKEETEKMTKKSKKESKKQK